MRLKRFLAVILSVSVMAATFAGCSSDKKDDTATNATAGDSTGTTAVVAEDVTLKIWIPEEWVDLVEDKIEGQFEKLHPEFNITWDLVVYGVDETVNALETDADQAADVFLFPSGSLGQLTEKGLLYPITYDYDRIVSDNGEGAITACSLDNMLYGVPCQPNSWFMYYDSSKYTEEEVKSLDTMMAKDLGDGVYNFACCLHDGWYIEAFYLGAGCSLFGADGKDDTICDWNNEMGYKVSEYLIDMVNSGKYVEDQDGLGGSLMSEGKLAAICTGTWGSTDIKKYLGDNYACCKLPTFTIDGKEYQMSNFADYKAWGVKSNTKYPLAAQAFASYLGSEECQLQFYQCNSATPTVQSLMENSEVNSDMATCALIAQSAVATAQPYISQISEYWTPAGALGTGIVNKEITRDNLQKNLDSFVESVLSKIAE